MDTTIAPPSATGEQEVTRYVLLAPELHHVTDKPPEGAFMRYERMSLDARLRNEWTGFAHRTPLIERILFHPLTSITAMAAGLLLAIFL